MSHGIHGAHGHRHVHHNHNIFGGVNQSTIAQNAKLIESTLNLAQKAIDLAGKIVDQMSKAVDSHGGPSHSGGCFPCERPDPCDAVRDANALKVDSNGVITTPGGYKIEQLGQFEWKVSGPDGKSTRVWGDPHVDESDGGKFDFKRDTSFVLGDGTRINVTTKPWGNDMTVTGQLDIVSGDSHVRVTDIDKGKGKVGQVTYDGMDENVRFNSKPGVDIFQMGKETDDWLYEGKEIIGSEKGGEIIKTKNEPTILPQRTTPFHQADNKPLWQDLGKLNQRFDAISKLFDRLTNPRTNGFNPFRRQDDIFGQYNRNQHRSGMTQAFNAMSNMFKALEQLSRLNDMVRFRGPQMF